MAYAKNITPNQLLTTNGIEALTQVGTNNTLENFGMWVTKDINTFVNTLCGGVYQQGLFVVSHDQYLACKNGGNGTLIPIVELTNGNKFVIYNDANNMRPQFRNPQNQVILNLEYMGFSGMESLGHTYNLTYYFFVSDSVPNQFGVTAFWFNSSTTSVISNNGVKGFKDGYPRYNISTWNTIIDGSAITEDPYITAPESTPDGGYGDFDYKSDTIALPTAPTISVSDSGFVTLYKPSLGQLQSLAAYMWSGLFDIATFRKIFADPMDCIISLALIPINPTASGSQELTVGNVGTGITVDKLPTQFVEVTFNSLNIGRRANNFMDYSPYTKLQIYLPFIGTRSLSIDDIAGKNVTLKYIIDIFTGACNASIGVEVTDRDGTQKTTCLYQFTGNVLANVPVTANNFASFLQATVGAVSTAVGVATGAGALAGVASAINASQSMKPDIEKSGNLSSTAGFLGVQKPYLILTYPNLCRPEGRDKVTGTPSFLGLSSNKKLSSFHGYTQLHRVNVQGITCTETERQMILSQLTGEGVILP